MFDIKERDTFSDVEKLLFNIWQELRFISGLQVALLNDEVKATEQPKNKKQKRNRYRGRNP
jgi:hypothetical protein